jgi:hypothetical protein
LKIHQIILRAVLLAGLMVASAHAQAPIQLKQMTDTVVANTAETGSDRQTVVLDGATNRIVNTPTEIDANGVITLKGGNASITSDSQVLLIQAGSGQNTEIRAVTGQTATASFDGAEVAFQADDSTGNTIMRYKEAGDAAGLQQSDGTNIYFWNDTSTLISHPDGVWGISLGSESIVLKGSNTTSAGGVFIQNQAGTVNMVQVDNSGTGNIILRPVASGDVIYLYDGLSNLRFAVADNTSYVYGANGEWALGTNGSTGVTTLRGTPSGSSPSMNISNAANTDSMALFDWNELGDIYLTPVAEGDAIYLRDHTNTVRITVTDLATTSYEIFLNGRVRQEGNVFFGSDGAVNYGGVENGNAAESFYGYNHRFEPASSPRTTSSTSAGEMWMTNGTPDAGLEDWTVYVFDGSNWAELGGGTGGGGAAGAQAVQVFTSSGTWTKPSNLSHIKVEVVGGGAGPNNGAHGGGGGAGGYSMEILDSSEVGSSETVTIGAGGTYAVAGGTSSFASYLQATGGGVSSSSYGGAAGVGSGGDLNLDGGLGFTSDPALLTGGQGAHSILGGGSTPGTSSTVPGVKSNVPGSGGGGHGSSCGGTPGTQGCGTYGTDGIVIVYEFFNVSALSFTQQDSIQTTTGSPDSTAVYDLATGESAYVRVKISAKVNGGTPGNSAVYIRECRAEDSGGTVTVYDVSTPFTSEDVAGWDATLTASGTNIVAQVTGQAATTIDWEIKWEVINL